MGELPWYPRGRAGNVEDTWGSYPGNVEDTGGGVTLVTWGTQVGELPW